MDWEAVPVGKGRIGQFGWGVIDDRRWRTGEQRTATGGSVGMGRGTSTDRVYGTCLRTGGGAVVVL